MGSLYKKEHKPTQHLTHHVVNPFLSLQKEVDKALNGFYDIFEAKPFNFHAIENMCIAPAMDLIEDLKCYKLEVEMPGMDEQDIKVSLNDNILTICGEKSTSKKDERKNFIAREINYGRYERSIALPQAADGNKVSASFKKGMLWITIPKKTTSKKNKHEIKIEKAK